MFEYFLSPLFSQKLSLQGFSILTSCSLLSKIIYSLLKGNKWLFFLHEFPVLIVYDFHHFFFSSLLVSFKNTLILSYLMKKNWKKLRTLLVISLTLMLVDEQWKRKEEESFQQQPKNSLLILSLFYYIQQCNWKINSRRFLSAPPLSLYFSPYLLYSILFGGLLIQFSYFFIL